ncbi:T9SS type A sorting domain-containing protein [Saccharicrinis aurantiacus]|uniref:T9SS type A sorting domain-containing protein n=1 Tax=Saccharicrinis aurantiacus TaxID=1849719 RepID=UPI0024928FF4|nr:T9SS type A sorting domain-containing protein [Saccharicrinis aurantiacus]
MDNRYTNLKTILLFIFLVPFTLVNGQYITVYENDFNSFVGNLDTDKLDDNITNAWVGANHPNGLASDGAGGITTISNWRGYNMSGNPLNYWKAGNSIRITSDVKINDIDLTNGNAARNFLFGITQRVPLSGNTVTADKNSSGSDVTLGFETYTNNGLFFRSINDNLISHTAADITDGDIVRFTYTVTKKATENMFDIELKAEKVEGENVIEITTLNKADLMHEKLYQERGDMLAFTVYIKQGLQGAMSWDYLKLEMEQAPYPPNPSATITSATDGYSRGDNITVMATATPNATSGSPIASMELSDGINTYPMTNNGGTYEASFAATKWQYNLTVTAKDEDGVTDADIKIITMVEPAYAGGDGDTNPYQINSAALLSEVSQYVGHYSKNFILTSDIDMDGHVYHPMGYTTTNGDITKFTGDFDGDNHVIKNLTVTRHEDQNNQFFGMFGDASGNIMNLGLINVNINADDNQIDERIAAFCGQLYDFHSVENCYVLGGTIRGSGKVGSIVGYLPKGSVTNCFADVNIVANYSSGGIVAMLGDTWANGNASVSNCAFYGHIKDNGVEGTANAVVGLITAYTGDPVYTPTVSNSYYDENCGVTDDNATSLTAVELLNQGSYVNFDFTTTPTWKMLTNGVAVLNSFDDIDYGGIFGSVEATIEVEQNDEVTVPSYINSLTAINWEWTISDNSISLNGSDSRSALFTAPIVSQDTDVTLSLTATNDNGDMFTGSTVVTIIYDTSTALEVDKISNIVVYPNPIQDMVYINNAAVGDNVVVYSATGNVVKAVVASDESLSIDMSDQATGVYIIKVGNEAIRVLKK